MAAFFCQSIFYENIYLWYIILLGLISSKEILIPFSPFIIMIKHNTEYINQLLPKVENQ
jgi:hypothetical protein